MSVESSLVEKSVEYLGRNGTDKITGAVGYIQVSLDRGLDNDGKRHENFWYDIQRIVLSSQPPIMPLPAFSTEPTYEPQGYDRGPADKGASRF